jgi:hypothetical protein
VAKGELWHRWAGEVGRPEVEGRMAVGGGEGAVVL